MNEDEFISALRVKVMSGKGLTNHEAARLLVHVEHMQDEIERLGEARDTVRDQLQAVMPTSQPAMVARGKA